MASIVKAYLDTNILLNARHYLECKGLQEQHYNDGMRTGRKVVEALNICREKVDKIEIITSRLAQFEMDRKYRSWIIKTTFLDLGFPLEVVEDNNRVLHSSYSKLPDNIKSQAQQKIENNLNWLDVWEYHDLVTLEPLNSKIFEIGAPIAVWGEGMDLLDSLHVSEALLLGASFFVTSDNQLLKQVKAVDKRLRKAGFLPDGSSYITSLESMAPKEFAGRIREIRV